MKQLSRALCAVCLSFVFCLQAKGAAIAIFPPSALALPSMTAVSLLLEERVSLPERPRKNIRTDLARASGSLGVLCVVSGAELLLQKRKR